MKVFGLFVLFSLLLMKCQGQTPIEIPEFKKINPKDIYPTNTMLANYTSNFDIIISLKEFSNWGPDYDIKMLAYNRSGWYKIEMLYLDKSIRDSIYKVDDSIGKLVWDSLTLNHFFDMEDERTKKMECTGKSDTIRHKNGKVEVVELHYDIDDGPEYLFEIITKNNFKSLYFYSPEYFNENCRKVDERTWIINCISIFEKHLGY